MPSRVAQSRNGGVNHQDTKVTKFLSALRAPKTFLVSSCLGGYLHKAERVSKLLARRGSVVKPHWFPYQSTTTGTPGSYFEVRMASADLTWATLGAAVSLVVRKRW